MAKHRRIWNSNAYTKCVREGRGQGNGVDYKPWILIQDFTSVGMVSRVSGVKTGRIHHLMSNLELWLFYLLDWSDDVLDIREQYPLLDLALAINIAESKNIKYPYDPRSGFPYVLTSDFYIETRQGAYVLSVKPSSELSNLRVREKLEIEHRYWKECGVSWSIMTEREINKTKAVNIEWLAQAKDLGAFGLSESMQIVCIEYFLANYRANHSALVTLFTEVEHIFDLVAGMGLNIFKHLAYWKRITFDAEKRVDFSEFIVGPELCHAGGVA